MSNILCVEDQPTVGVTIERTLNDLGHQPVLVASVEEALQALAHHDIDLVIADYPMADQTGRDVLDVLRGAGIEAPVIIMTDYASVQDAVTSIRRGAVDYLTKPLRQEALRLAVNNAIEIGRLRRENEDIRREMTSLQGMRTIVGESKALQTVREVIAAVAPTRATVLLEGESGTGKELFARAIHEQSPRHNQPLVTVNCAALPEGLVESALFGHERGAFTGATARTAGAFERAHRGTLLLDEISEMRLDLQAKLLRALQEQEFERVGGGTPIRVDVRLVATTNRDLRAEVEAGRFRRDLYYRLSVVPVRTPPLRERIEDIPALVHHFVRQISMQLGVRPPDVPAETLEYLQRRAWPGNIRELANAVERAVILCRHGRLTWSAFEAGAPSAVASFGDPDRAGEPDRVEEAGVAVSSGPVSDTLNLKDLERIMISRALQTTGGHRARAASLLGISERTLRNKLNFPRRRLA